MTKLTIIAKVFKKSPMSLKVASNHASWMAVGKSWERSSKYSWTLFTITKTRITVTGASTRSLAGKICRSAYIAVVFRAAFPVAMLDRFSGDGTACADLVREPLLDRVGFDGATTHTMNQ